MRFVVPLVVLSGVLLVERPARACSEDGCGSSPRWQDLELRSASPVAVDGALVFEGDAGRHACLADLEPHITVEVRADGEVLAGQVSLIEDLPGLIVWRPELPLRADAEHAIHVEIDNDAIEADPEGWCGPGQLSADFSVHTAAGPGPRDPVPEVTGEMTVVTGSTGGLATLACCPGASAGYEVVDSCGGKGLVITPEGAAGCAFVYERTSFYVDLAGAHAVTPAQAGQYMYEVRFDGELRTRSLAPNTSTRYFRGEPGCVTLEAVHLGGGARLVSPAVCFGEDVAGQLGVRQVDVAATLACAPRICAVKGEQIDPDDCQAYDPEDPPEIVAPPAPPEEEPVCPAPAAEAGCGCAQAPSSGLCWLALAMLVRARRRRWCAGST